MTNREAVSRAINGLRLLNIDEHISRRYVLKVLRDNVKTLISQKLLDRTIKKDTNLFSYISCVEFKKEEVIKCPIIDFRRCDILMKSKNPLPEPIYSRLGASIMNVESIDGNVELSFKDKKQYRRDKNRRYSTKEVGVYIGEDFHLYIPDREIYSINLELITMESDKIDDCSSCSEPNCKSGWEYSFICPDKLIKTVFDLTIQELASTFRKIIPDQNPNDIEQQ